MSKFESKIIGYMQEYVKECHGKKGLTNSMVEISSTAISMLAKVYLMHQMMMDKPHYHVDKDLLDLFHRQIDLIPEIMETAEGVKDIFERRCNDKT